MLFFVALKGSTGNPSASAGNKGAARSWDACGSSFDIFIQAYLTSGVAFQNRLEKMAEIGVIVRSDQEQEVQYAVQYVLIPPLNFILSKMACLPCCLTQAIAVFLREVNKDRAENGLSPVGTSAALMFLLARKFNAERAVTLYRQYQVRIL